MEHNVVMIGITDWLHCEIKSSSYTKAASGTLRSFDPAVLDDCFG
jgi:hypothetical protein